jgi:hypothetical protein
MTSEITSLGHGHPARPAQLASAIPGVARAPGGRDRSGR